MKRTKEEINDMVEKNLGLVFHVVRTKFRNDIIEDPNLMDEYIGVGNIGLLKACEKFDENKGYQFSSYACPLIQGEIKRFKRDNGNLIKIPRDVHIFEVKYMREKRQGKDIGTISTEIGISQNDIAKWENIKNIASLNAPLKSHKVENKSGIYADIISNDVDVEEIVISKVEREEKIDILKQILNDDDLKIIKLISAGIYKQNDLAKKLNTSQTLISRKLRKLTQEIGPALEEYYSGKISWEEMRKRMNYRKEKNKKIEAVI